MLNGNINIVVIGNIIKETIKFPDRTLGPVLGSPAAYSSLVIAALGKKVGLVTHYGSDLEDGLLQQLDIVDKKGFIKYQYSTTNMLIYKENGSKYVEFLRKAPTIKFTDIPQEYINAEIFYICPMDYDVDIEVIQKLHDLGKTVIVDLGGYGGATSSNHYSIHDELGKTWIKNICSYSTIIKSSQEDLRHIAPGMTVSEIVDYFIGLGSRLCVVTLGSKGSVYKIAGEEEVYNNAYSHPNPSESLKYDFTGAGDSFGAGLTVSYSENKNIRSCYIWQCGSLTCY